MPNSDSNQPLSIVVLAGGPSAEREISLQSGSAVTHALRMRGHHVRSHDPAQGNLPELDWSEVDIVFLALHGEYGEDGAVQRQLDELGVPYTGSDPEACELTISKSACKERLFQHSVPTPQYVLIHETDVASHIQSQAAMLGYPLVVKPDTQGSSLGVSIVERPEDLPQALANAMQYDGYCLLEQYIDGTEWTSGLIGDRQLPLIQIQPGDGFYDFESKYVDDETDYEFEASVTDAVQQKIMDAAAIAASVTGVRGLSRVDLRVDSYGNPWVLEVNTIPGLTDHSLVPKAAQRTGVDLGELCEQVCRSAIAEAAVSVQDS